MFLNTRGTRIVKYVGCGYMFVSRSRELITNNVVFLDKLPLSPGLVVNDVPPLDGFTSCSVFREGKLGSGAVKGYGSGCPVSTGSCVPGRFIRDSSDVYPSLSVSDEDPSSDPSDK